MCTQTLTHVCKIRNYDQVADALDRMGLACSKLWNVALYHTRRGWDETGKIPSAYDTQKAVQDHYWFKQLPTHTAQAVTQELWQAYKSWFGHRKNGNPQAHPPKYRKRNGNVPLSTATFKRSGFKLEDTTLRLSRGKTVTAETGKQFLYLELALPLGADVSNPRLVRLVSRNGKWEAHLVCEVPVAKKAPGKGVAAIDLGIINLTALAYSDGTTELYGGRGLLSQEYYFAKQIAKCKPSAWQPGSREPHPFQGWERQISGNLVCNSNRYHREK